MNEDKWTEPTVLSASILRILFDWISALKPSSTRPPFPFLTPLLSRLSLPSLLTSFIPFISCHNNITYLSPQLFISQLSLFTSSNLTSSLSPLSFSKVYVKKVWLLIPLIRKLLLLVPIFGSLMLHLCCTREYLKVHSLKEPLLANFWKSLRICTMINKCQLLKKSVAYLGTLKCLLLVMSNL